MSSVVAQQPMYQSRHRFILDPWATSDQPGLKASLCVYFWWTQLLVLLPFSYQFSPSKPWRVSNLNY